jgi:two-component system sensor kinase FixL
MTIQPDPPDAAQALHALRVSDARWQAVLATSRDAVISIDAAGCSRSSTGPPRRCSLRGRGGRGPDVTMLMPAPYSEQHAEYLRRYQRTGERHAIGRIRSVQGRTPERRDVSARAVGVGVAHRR